MNLTKTITIALILAQAAFCLAGPTNTEQDAKNAVNQVLERRMRLFDCLAVLETGNNDKAIGPNGERSRYQITEKEWDLRWHYNFVRDSSIPFKAQKVADSIIGERIDAFKAKYHREPTVKEWALLWHCPSRVENPDAEERDYAQRFENLVERN